MEMTDLEDVHHEVAQEVWYALMTAVGARQNMGAYSRVQAFPLEIHVRLTAHLWLQGSDTDVMEGRFIRN